MRGAGRRLTLVNSLARAVNWLEQIGCFIPFVFIDCYSDEHNSSHSQLLP